MKTGTRNSLELWRHDNLEGRRAFLEGTAAKLARDIIDDGGVLAWHADELTDAGNRMKGDLNFQAFYERALAAVGHTAADEGPYLAMTDLADDVAVRAYLVGVAVGLRLTGGAS